MSTTKLWENSLISKPLAGWPVNGVIADSAVVINSDNADVSNSMKAIFVFHVIDPDNASNTVDPGFSMTPLVEESLDSGVNWTPVAVSFDATRGTDEALNQIIVLSPTINFNPGTADKLFAGSKELVSTSHTTGVLQPAARYRVCLVMEITDPSKVQLESVTISCTFQRWKQ
jgi:hypothetical protein